MTSVLNKRQERRGLVKTEAETRVLLPQVKGHLEPPEAGEARKGPSLSAWRDQGLLAP